MSQRQGNCRLWRDKNSIRNLRMEERCLWMSQRSLRFLNRNLRLQNAMSARKEFPASQCLFQEKGGKLGLSETDNMKDSVAEWHDYKDIFVSLPHQTKLRAI